MMSKTLSKMKSTIARPKNLLLILSVLLISIFRLFWLPGLSFNQQNWDDEIRWINDSSSMSSLEYLVQRDLPGYFVFIPRLVIILSENVPFIGSISSLRVLVFVIQMLCFAAAVLSVVDLRSEWRFGLLIFISLSLTYVEELNYLHNVGYLFIFPIIYLVFRRIEKGLPVRIGHFFFALLLISKPFTAIIVLLLVLFYFYRYRQQRVTYLVMGLYSIIYLATYMLLPHEWDTPFNFDYVTVFKIVFDLPWVLFSIAFPAFSIGVLGLFRYLDLPLLRDVFSTIIYLLMTILAWKNRQNISIFLRQSSSFTKALIIVFVINYLLVFSASDSYWIKYFPLFQLDSPQFLWARWSAVLPLAAILIVASLSALSLRLRIFFLCFISIQWVLLSILGQTWLRRYW